MTLLFCGEALHVPMWLINALKSGEASLFADGTKTLQLKVEDKKIDVNLMNKELLKDLLKSAEVKEESPIEKLTMLKNLAEELKKDGFTITISLQRLYPIDARLRSRPHPFTSSNKNKRN